MSTTALSSIAAGTWNVDPSHSSVEFQVKHMGIATVKGQFKEFQGSLVIGEDGTGTASGTVEVATVDTRDAQRDEHLRSPDFFDAAQFPQITFTSTQITPVDEDSFKVVGDITIHGITKSITLDAEVQGSDVDPWGNTRVAIEAKGQINRSDFEMKFNQALGSGNMLVADKVKIAVDISAIKA